MKSEKKVLGNKMGVDVLLYTLANDNGMEIEVTELGAQILSIKVPARNGSLDDVTLHYTKFEDIVDNPLFFGAVVARNANRIANAKFTLDGKEYKLTDNDNGNNLHSGNDYFHRKCCLSQRGIGDGFVYAEFSYSFKDMEQGFPGDADFKVRYILSNDNSLRIIYSMTSSKNTIFNPTSHIYFNLAGHKNGHILDHEVTIYADKYTPINEVLIPDGIKDVKGTPLDFYTKAKPLSDGIRSEDVQIVRAGGFDHNFVIKDFDGKEKKVAEVYEPTTGRVMEVFSDLEGIQLYSGNFIKNYHEGKDGATYDYRAGFCLETQHFPNAINNSDFISPIIKANVEAKTSTVYKFSTR